MKARGPLSSPSWSKSAERRELLAIYSAVDERLAAWSCTCARVNAGGFAEARCCHFAVTGREPYPTAVELEEVRHAIRSVGPPPKARRALPMVSEFAEVADRAELAGPARLGACPLLSEDGRCRIYASRPFGCRTFFCDHAEGPWGGKRRFPRDEINALGRRVADLSARFAPRDPGPRPLVKALHGRKPG